jgi:hypothetical protein
MTIPGEVSEQIGHDQEASSSLLLPTPYVLALAQRALANPPQILP